MSGIHKRRGRVLVEFTEDTFDELGEPKRRTGEQVWVDPESAKSFVDIKKVAKRVEDGEPEASELASDVAVVEDQGSTDEPPAPETEPEKPATKGKAAADKPAKVATETAVTDAPPVGDA